MKLEIFTEKDVSIDVKKDCLVQVKLQNGTTYFTIFYEGEYYYIISEIDIRLEVCKLIFKTYQNG